MMRSVLSFLRRRDGLAYLEFAITAPVLVALFLGAVEVTRYIVIAQKVEKATVTMSDIVAQCTTIGTTQMNQLVDAVGQVMQPYTFGANGYVIVSSVSRTGTNNPIMNWQYTGGGSWTQSSQIGLPLATPTLPNGFTLDANENVIITEIYYYYTPLLTTTVMSPGTIYKVSFYRPRLGTLTSLGS